MRAAQRQGGGRPFPGGNPPSFPSETGFDWLTDEQIQSYAAAHQLSNRQAAVLHGMCRDEERKEMAKRLGIEIGSINTHLARVYRKVGVHDERALLLEVFRFALRPGKKQ